MFRAALSTLPSAPTVPGYHRSSVATMTQGGPVLGHHRSLSSGGGAIPTSQSSSRLSSLDKKRNSSCMVSVASIAISECYSNS